MAIQMSLLCWLPTELIIAIATLLDASSLFRLESVCPLFLPVFVFPLFYYPANLMPDV